MTATTFCDLPGTRALVRAHKHAAASGAELRLVVPPGTTLVLPKMVGLHELVSIYLALVEALAGEPAPDVGAPG